MITKKKIIFLNVLLVLGLVLFILLFFNTRHNVIINSDTNNIMNINALTMMYETSPDSGEYQVSSDVTWA